MGGSPFSLANPRTRLAVILTTFFALVFLILVPRSSDTSPYSKPRPGSWKSTANRWLGLSEPKTVEEVQHPIPKLMREAQVNFRSLITKQSKTLSAAVKEYRRRYKRDPPKGFDEWFAFAQENKAKIIDEYDSLVNDLEPFWSMSGEELRRRALQIGSLPSVDLVRLVGGKTVTINLEKGYEDAEVSARAKGFRVMMEKFQAKLPDMDFPINAKAEGRILVPWENRKYPNTTKQDSSLGVEDMLGGPFIPDWRGDGSVWDAYRKTCPPSSQARRLFGALRPSSNTIQKPINRLETATMVDGVPSRPDADFNFQESVDDQFDFCAHPWARFNQGHFFSDWRTIPVLYPIFSPAKGDGYSDIMIPSHYYYSSTKRYTYGWDPVNMVLSDDDENEQPWDKKKDLIFWRGATTGGGSSPPGFLAQYQRHRFIKMTSDMSDTNRTVVFPYPEGSNEYAFAKVPVQKLNSEIMDTAFTKAVGCTQYPGGCDGMRKDHR
ncbi:capsule-associated protein CAP1, partial [Tulasnella sp. 427]